MDPTEQKLLSQNTELQISLLLYKPVLFVKILICLKILGCRRFALEDQVSGIAFWESSLGVLSTYT